MSAADRRLYRAEVTVEVYYWSEPGSEHHDAASAARDEIRDNTYNADAVVSEVRPGAAVDSDWIDALPQRARVYRDERTVREILAEMGKG